MCLRSNTSDMTIATKDIVCYKIVTFNKISKLYHTPFQFYEIQKEIIDGKCDFEAKDKKQVYREIGYYTIHGGFIHTYKTLKKAKELKKGRYPFIFIRYYIYKCVIPKGTYYYKGVDNDYASEKIKFIGKAK